MAVACIWVAIWILEAVDVKEIGKHAIDQEKKKSTDQIRSSKKLDCPENSVYKFHFYWSFIIS